MAVGRSIENISKDLTGNFERDLNILVQTIITDLSTKENSPVDTGFFASSWTASTQRPRPDQSRKEFAPWSNIKPSRNASYNCDGCLFNISTVGNITLHLTFETFPISSAFIKLAILPKKIPIGETQATISNKKKDLIFLFLANK